MPNIHITEVFSDDNRAVEILVVGTLGRESVPVLREICEKHLKAKIRVACNLQDLQHTSREGKNFLEEIGDQVSYLNVPMFLRLGEQDSQGT